MSLTQIDESGAVRQLAQLWQVDEGGVLRQLKELWQNDESNTPRKIFNNGAGRTLSSSYATGYGASRNNIRITVESVSVVDPPSGATYAWIIDGTGWQALTSNAQQTQFRSPALGPEQTSTTTARCAVTSGSSTNNTSDVTLYAENGGVD